MQSTGQMMQQLPQHSSVSSTSLASLQSQAQHPFTNGMGDISLAVMANPAKIQETIRELSENERNPHLYTQTQQADADESQQQKTGQPDIIDQERMHLSDVSRTADDILMEKMETAGYFDQQNNVSGSADGNALFAGSNGALNKEENDPFRDRFFNIPQQDLIDNDEFDDVRGNEFLPEDTFHSRFTAPKSELDASGVHADEVLTDAEPDAASNEPAVDAARTQAVRMNIDNNAVNTFDNSVYATQAPDQYIGHSDGQDKSKQRQQKSAHSSDSSGEFDKSVSESPQKSATESDPVAYEYERRQRQRRRRKKEKRRRERLPHERTYGEWQEERYEDWERKIQEDVKNAEDTEKRQLLVLFAEKEQEGHKMLRSFNMSSDLNEMRFWYYKLLRDERTDDEVAHLRSHLVEGTRMLLFLNENVFENPLGLADMTEFADTLSSMLVGSWDRHIREYVKSKNGLQGPPPQPLRNLGLNFLHLFISHHRKKSAEEQKEKKQREAAQREALFAAAQQRRGAEQGNGAAALNPFEAIFGERTSFLRGGAGVNPMEMPTYASASAGSGLASDGRGTLDPEYAQYLAFKRQKDSPEYREFLEFQRQRYGQKPQAPTSSRPAYSAQKATKRAGSKFDRSSYAGNHSSTRQNVSASPLPDDMQPPEVAPIDVVSTDNHSLSDFRQPASQPPTRVRTERSNSWLVGEKSLTANNKNNSDGKKQTTNGNSKQSGFGVDRSLLLSTSAASSVSDSTVTSATESGNQSSRKPPTPASPPQLPKPYITTSKGTHLLQSLAKRNGIVDETEISLPPVPDISREAVQRLQARLASAKKSSESRLQVAGMSRSGMLQSLRPRDKANVEQVLERQRNKSKSLVQEQQIRADASNQNSQSETVTVESVSADITVESQSATEGDSSDYNTLLAQMQAQCDALDEDEEDLEAYDDVANVPDNASEMDKNKKDNKILEMLSMFQNFMSKSPKGERPTAQSSMFSDIDSLLSETDNRNNSNESSASATEDSSRRRRRRRGRRAKSGRSTSTSSGSSNTSGKSNQSSSASFRLDNTENFAAADDLIDSQGRFTF